MLGFHIQPLRHVGNPIYQVKVEKTEWVEQLQERDEG